MIADKGKSLEVQSEAMGMKVLASEELVVVMTEPVAILLVCVVVEVVADGKHLPCTMVYGVPCRNRKIGLGSKLHRTHGGEGHGQIGARRYQRGCLMQMI